MFKDEKEKELEARRLQHIRSSLTLPLGALLVKYFRIPSVFSQENKRGGDQR